MARTKRQTHDAGRYFAVAEALMRGYRAVLVDGPGPSGIQVNGHCLEKRSAVDLLSSFAPGYLFSRPAFLPSQSNC